MPPFKYWALGHRAARVPRFVTVALVAALALVLVVNSESRAAVVEPVGETTDAAVVAAETAVAALSKHVTKASNSTALRTAFVGYYRYRAANPDRVRKPFLYYVDLGLDSQTPRGYMFDMSALELVEGPFAVAHGRGSSPAKAGVPETFSNVAGSFATSLGLYLAGSTYSFHGTSGGRTYSATGLRLEGQSGSFNDAAESRGIVAHGAPYVTARTAGRSEGCPAMEPARAARLLPKLADGGVVFLFSPNDARWLRDDPWITETR